MKFLVTICLALLLHTDQKEYYIGYFNNGNMKEQGWLLNQQKVDYWYFYNEHGALKAEGHYKNGMKNNWWIYYNDKKEITHKCQLKNGVKNGYCLKYKDNKLNSAVKFENGKKINEWFSFYSFKRDNDISALKK